VTVPETERAITELEPSHNATLIPQATLEPTLYHVKVDIGYLVGVLGLDEEE
jgi:hypothetical protein